MRILRKHPATTRNERIQRLFLAVTAALLLLPGLLTGCSSGGGNSTPTPVPVSITTSTLPLGVVSTAYSASLAASGGTAPYTYTVTSGVLPTGIAFAASGVFSGTPTAAGSNSLTVQATDSLGAHGSATLTLAVASVLTFSGSSLTSGIVGTAYTATVTASGGTAPYTYTLSSGSLPAGLTLSTSGSISGTPTTTGSSSFAVLAKDSGGQSVSANFTLAISPAVLGFTSISLPTGTVGTAYTATLTAAGGVPPYTFTLTSGTLPAGLTLSAAGVISGNPTAAVSPSLTFTVTDSASKTATVTLTLLINPAPLVLTTTSIPAASANASYYQTLAATGGTTPYSFAVTTGSLPTGITLSTAGVLSGTPTVPGASTFTVTVTDSSTTPKTASGSFTLNVYNVQVSVTPATVLATLPTTAYGLHTSVYDADLDDVTGLPPALATDGIAMLRYPGGLYSDAYHWAQYTMTPFFPPTSPACGAVANGYIAPNTDFGTFIKVLAATKTQAIITVNYGTSVANSTASKTIGSYSANNCSQPDTYGQPEEAAAWVAYANGSPTNTQTIGVDTAGFNWQTVGFWASLRAASPLQVDDGYNFLRIGQTAAVGVKYWELGNELFYNGYNSNQNSETDLHAPYVYPNGTGSAYSSRSNVSALSPTSYGSNVVPFITAMKAVDPTIKIGLVLSSPNVDPIPSTWNPAAIKAVCTSTTFDFGIFHYYPGTYLGSTAAQLLTLPQTNMPALVTTAQSQIAQYCSNTGTPVQFFVTETGPNPSLAAGTPSAVLGLYSANVYLAAFQAGIANVDWLEMHNNTGYLTGTSISETPGPAYWGIELAHLLAAPGDSLVTATSSSSSIVSYAAAKSGGQQGVLLINSNATSAQTVLVTVAGSTITGTATQYSYGINSTGTTDALPSSTFAVSGNSFLVTVPAYTATTILFP